MSGRERLKLALTAAKHRTDDSYDSLSEFSLFFDFFIYKVKKCTVIHKCSTNATEFLTDLL